MSKNRAQLSPYFQELRTFLPEIVSIMQEGNESWYVSILVENRHKRDFRLNLRSHSSGEKLNEGIVLRIYDGYTLHEDASDCLEHDAIERQAKSFVARVKAIGEPKTKPKYYVAPNWKERLQGKFEPEILEQIPENVDAKTFVHFGSPQKQQVWEKSSVAMDYGNKILAEMKDYVAKLPKDDPCSSPDFLQTMFSLEKEDFLFLDRETNMSQSLLLNRLVIYALKGGERGYAILGGRGGLETISYGAEDIEETFDSLRKALKAERLKPGHYLVLMGPDVSGVFAHEAFGHSQEGDTCARGRSKAWELYHSKESVGNQNATILNNPAIYKNAHYDFAAWGSYYFDEEGWLAQKQYLVKGGELQAPMTNLTSSIRLNMPRTANAKREDWSHGVYVRQTNTYFEEGTKTFDELISQVDYGFLALYPAGGMEDPKGMGIQVGIAYLEEIRDGKLTGNVFKGSAGGSVQMTGYTPDYLNAILDKSKIDAFSKDKDISMHPENKVGGCGKYHKELVEAGSGGPYMLVKNVLLG